MSDILPGATWVNNPRSGGGSFDPEGEGYPYRIVLHLTQSRNMPDVSTHQYPPHLWYHFINRTLLQTVYLDRSGFALYQGPYAPYYTNRANCLQVELIGYSEEAETYPDEYLRNIAEDVIVPLIQYVRSIGYDIDLSDEAVPLPGAIPNSAREDAPQRLDPDIWAFGPIGISAHRHIPMGDDHWDTGLLNIRRIRDITLELLTGIPGVLTIPKAPVARKRRKSMDFFKRPGGPFGFEGYTGPVDFWDFPLVPAGSSVAVTKAQPEVGDFNVTVLANGVKTDFYLETWGQPNSTPIKTDSFVTVIVPTGFPCRVVAV